MDETRAMCKHGNEIDPRWPCRRCALGMPGENQDQDTPQDAVDLAIKITTYYCGGYDFADGELTKMISAALHRHADRIENEKWISVEDRMPEEGKQVFTYSPTMGMGGGFNQGGELCIPGGLSIPGVTHWREGPQPPKKEGDPDAK